MKKKSLFILLLFVTSLLHAQVQYVEKTIKAYSSAVDTKLSGKILPTTPLEVLKVTEDKALVKLTGWHQNKVNRILYYSKGVRIISAVFTKKANFEQKVLKTETINNKLWTQVTITVWVENKNLVSDINKLFGKAQNLMQTNCGLCHAFHPTKDFSANQWPAIIKGMAPRTPMGKEQILLITQFAQKHSKN